VLLLRVLALVLIVAAFLTGLTVGMYILPSALLAAVSAAFSLASGRDDPAERVGT
jgi:hypothetical protein